MAAITIENIRNIAFVGHTGAGKTSLAEAMLFKAGVTNRLGNVNDGTSVLDFTEEEKEKKSSYYSAMCHLPHAGVHINIVDTPGSSDFCGQAIAALIPVETAVVVISAADGIGVNTRKMLQRAREFGLATMIVVTRIDADTANPEELVGQIQESFGAECVPVNLPAGGAKSVVGCFPKGSGTPDFGDIEDAYTAAVEAIVGADDDLMEKYLGGETNDDEIAAFAPKAMAQGAIIPILFANSREDVGIAELLDKIVSFAPNPFQGKQRVLVDDENEIAIDQAGPDFVAQVFKVMTDVKSNIKYSFVRILSGAVDSASSMKTTGEGKALRAGQVQHLIGTDHAEIDQGTAGDIVAFSKLDLRIGDVLYSKQGGKITTPKFPDPMFALAIQSKGRGDDDKISSALKRFTEEDPCFKITRDPVMHELVINGVGDLHVRSILARMAKQFKVEVDTKPPKIPYRETITGSVRDIEYTHKKQSGGAGQFARVIINMMPNERGAGYEFIDKIFGGAIDQSFRPSVDKGIKGQMTEGVLAGYPVVDVKVELIDGKTHPVDSKDIAFQIAGRGVFKDAFLKCKPALLEPIVNIEVTAPAEFVGDLQGDLASRRGRPQGQDMLPGNMVVLKAVVPLAEVADYHSRLSSITAGQGSYSMEFSHYESVPGNVQQQVIDQAKKVTEPSD
ncbi:MAG: elongation factor G [Phycisphaerae bacterium]|nr:elongation factor G [Phycisphaerae bacterium]